MAVSHVRYVSSYFNGIVSSNSICSVDRYRPNGISISGSHIPAAPGKPTNPKKLIEPMESYRRIILYL